MVSDVESTRNVWVLLNDLTAKHLANLLEDTIKTQAKNLEAIDRVLELIDDSSASEEFIRTRFMKMSNDENEKLVIYREILEQVRLADTGTITAETIKGQPPSYILAPNYISLSKASL